MYSNYPNMICIYSWYTMDQSGSPLLTMNQIWINAPLPVNPRCRHPSIYHLRGANPIMCGCDRWSMSCSSATQLILALGLSASRLSSASASVPFADLLSQGLATLHRGSLRSYLLPASRVCESEPLEAGCRRQPSTARPKPSLPVARTFPHCPTGSGPGHTLFPTRPLPFRPIVMLRATQPNLNWIS